jgi:hypothetical protein
MAGEPQLQQGHNDADWVKYLQETLTAWGYSPGPVDGVFGPRTEAAVIQFQANNPDGQGNPLLQDGIVGPKTWGGLTRGMGAFQADNAGSGERLYVDNPVSLVSQTTNNTCWAASSAMLLGNSEADVVSRVGNAGGDGASEPEMQSFTATLGLRIVAPASMMPEGWAQLLGHGPVMVGIPYHYIIVAGIDSDGTYGGTKLHIFDPAAGERWSDYQVIENSYEIDAASGANLIQR